MERLIRARLTKKRTLTSLLARYEGEVAIYYQKSPPDAAYPHIILTAERYYDAQKGVAGVLTADIITTEMGVAPEVIEKILRGELEGVFFKGEEIFLLKWRQSELFTEPASERLPLIFGATVLFDIYEFPTALTGAPDLVEALNNWAVKLGVKVIGVDTFEELEPTAESPAVYFDVQSVKLSEQTVSAVYMDAQVNVHLFAPGVGVRRQWLTLIHNELVMARALWLSDESPARLISSEYNAGATEVAGQVKLVYRYGLLRTGYEPPLMRVRVL